MGLSTVVTVCGTPDPTRVADQDGPRGRPPLSIRRSEWGSQEELDLGELPWWSSGYDFTLQCRGCRFSPWSEAKIPMCFGTPKTKHKTEAIL